MTSRYNRRMTVETTLQQMFDRYPDLFSTREECFDHLFCTIGNGYEWKWGQLVYHDRGVPGYNEAEEKTLNEEDYAKERHGQARQSKKNIEARRKRDSVFVKAGIIKNIDEHHWYPLSKRYSRLFTVPADVKEDWKAAVEECKKMLEKDGIDWRNAKDI